MGHWQLIAAAIAMVCALTYICFYHPIQIFHGAIESLGTVSGWTYAVQETADDSGGSAWHQTELPAAPALAKASPYRWVTLRSRFDAPAKCKQTVCSLVFTATYDIRFSVYVNEALVGQGGFQDENHAYRGEFPFAVAVPPDILRDQDNHVRISTLSNAKGRFGHFPNPYLVTEDAAHRIVNAAMLARTLMPLAAAVGIAVTAVVTFLFVKARDRRDQAFLAFMTFCAASVACQWCCSHIVDRVFSGEGFPLRVPTHKAIHAVVDWSLFILVTTFCGMTNRRVQIANFGFGLLTFFCCIKVAVIEFGLRPQAPILMYPYTKVPIESWGDEGLLIAFLLSSLPLVGSLQRWREGSRRLPATLLFLPVLITGKNWVLMRVIGADMTACRSAECLAIACVFAMALARRADRKQRSLEEGLRLAEAKTLVADQAAHDIRSPLMALDVACKNARSLLDNDSRTLLETSLGRLNAICASLTRNGSGAVTRHAVTPLTASICRIAQVVFAEHAARHQDSAIQLEMLAPRNLPDSKVVASETELGRMLSNLLNNAVEATGAASRPRVTLRVQLSSHTGVIIIEDNGAGIDDSVLARLGEVGNTKGKEGGQGLGLSHAVRQVELWGGTLQLSRRREGGTRAVVTLKRAPKACPMHA